MTSGLDISCSLSTWVTKFTSKIYSTPPPPRRSVFLHWSLKQEIVSRDKCITTGRVTLKKLKWRSRKKKNLNIRSLRPNSSLALGTHKPEKIFPHHRNTKSYTKARGDSSNHDTPPAPCNQTSILNYDMKITAFWGSSLSGAMLQSLVSAKLANFKSFATQCALLQSVKETLTEVLEMGFFDVNTDVKQTLFVL